MKVTLVRAPAVSGVDSVSVIQQPPISLAYLASSLEAKGHTVFGVDAVGEAITRRTVVPDYPQAVRHGLSSEEVVNRISSDSEMIGITCMFSNEWSFTKPLIFAIRKRFPSTPIVMGGEHITAVPEFCLRDCPAIDYVILGEGEDAVVELADAIEAGLARDQVISKVPGSAGLLDNGEVLFGPPPARNKHVDTIIDPDWTKFPIREYIDGGYTYGVDLGRSMPMLASRGCPYECTFCSSPFMWTTLWKARKPENVIAEMKRYMEEYGVTNFDFYDLTAIVKRDWIIEFSKMVIEKLPGITWQLPSGTRSEAIDAEVVELLYASGCRNMNYAPESGNPRVLKKIKKKIKPERMLASMAAAYRNKICIKANIMMGFPGETKFDLLATLKFIAQMAWVGVHDVSCFAFSPYPGSELFHDLEKTGRVKLGDDFLRSMVCYTVPSRAVSYSEHMSDRFLRFMTHFGMAFFYLCSFARYPGRGFSFVKNMLTKQPESKLETALFRMWDHRSGESAVEQGVA